MEFEVVGVRICRLDGGMVDNIMMASAGQGGAGLRGDQYYPPPPPFASSEPLCFNVLSSLFPLVPPVHHHHSRLHPTTSTFSPSFASSSSLVLRIELLGRRDASTRSITRVRRHLLETSIVYRGRRHKSLLDCQQHWFFFNSHIDWEVPVISSNCSSMHICRWNWNGSMDRWFKWLEFLWRELLLKCF